MRLPMVEDFVVPLGEAAAPLRARFPRHAAETSPAPAAPVPESAKTLVGLGLLAGLAMTIGGAYLGYRLLRGRFPLAGLVGGAAGFYLVPKIAGPIVGSLLKPQLDQATADMKARGLMGAGCAGCGG